MSVLGPTAIPGQSSLVLPQAGFLVGGPVGNFIAPVPSPAAVITVTSAMVGFQTGLVTFYLFLACSAGTTSAWVTQVDEKGSYSSDFFGSLVTGLGNPQTWAQVRNLGAGFISCSPYVAKLWAASGASATLFVQASNAGQTTLSAYATFAPTGG
jgi:hypothetical protein